MAYIIVDQLDGIAREDLSWVADIPLDSGLRSNLNPHHVIAFGKAKSKKGWYLKSNSFLAFMYSKDNRLEYLCSAVQTAVEMAIPFTIAIILSKQDVKVWQLALDFEVGYLWDYDEGFCYTIKDETVYTEPPQVKPYKLPPNTDPPQSPTEPPESKAIRSHKPRAER